MLRIALSILVIVIVGCAREKQSIQPGPDSTASTETFDSFASQSEPTSFPDFPLGGQVDIDSVLEDDYVARFDSGTLTLCCYDLLDIARNLPFKAFQRSTEVYKEEAQVQIVEVYATGESYFKMFYNSHPDVQKVDLVCGQISDEAIVLDRGVRIGMPKYELLTQIFNPSKTLDRVERLQVFEDDMGDAWTIYFFRNDTLANIEFDSSNDWVERKVRK